MSQIIYVENLEDATKHLREALALLGFEDVEVSAWWLEDLEGQIIQEEGRPIF